jgi:tetratricopeptide (TPR) repeat protein
VISKWVLSAVIVALVGTAASVHAFIDQRYRRFEPSSGMLYVTSPAMLSRLVLGYDALAADVYWIRAVQHYGDTKRSAGQEKRYELLYPLLDLTTTLDARFSIAYRFGAILLSEGYPLGPSRPDLAIKLLEKGLATDPAHWEYMHDIGFVHYWWLQDYKTAAECFLKASRLPDAPTWLVPLAASITAEGGDRRNARAMWTQIRDTAEQDWLKTTATTSLLRLDAEEQIEQLDRIVARYEEKTGRVLDSWPTLARAGYLRGIPLDPTGVPYVFDATTGRIDVAPNSQLFPLRRLK